MYFKHCCGGEKVSQKNESFVYFQPVFACFCKLYSRCSWLDELFLIWSGEVNIMINKICKDNVFQAWEWWWKGLWKIESFGPFSAIFCLFFQVDMNTFLKYCYGIKSVNIVLYLVFGLQSWAWLVGIKKCWKCWLKSMGGVLGCVFISMLIWFSWEVCNACFESLSFVDHLRWDMIKVWLSCLLPV